ncbi:M23 family metallopeptidase [Pontibacter sp. G13]|uniref:M23 family metallopeptidase n=1 Tax=Pontibacter sp. G13 TaxID=3074898 RepID=UPI0028890539|nr:M23 family metallopeptidase [Pontibacter sp. G13]WNJ16141.1 M23 family metallopeptidase [Pontibacter sp. G13]
MFGNRTATFLLASLCLLLICGMVGVSEPYRFPFDRHFALSGTYGELRRNHFHSGIDIKTYGETGIPIHAITDGYVYRLKVSPFGFGNAVYLKHTDGNYSVYAHLESFPAHLAAFIEEQQYQTEQTPQEIYPPKNQFPVKEGDVIGFSGNSGSSVGPHLHFEIRDAKEQILNPLSWYKDKIADTKPPLLKSLAFEPFDAQSRVNGSFDKFIAPISGGNGDYRITQPILIKGAIGVEYLAYDLLNAASNKCGINHARLSLDGAVIHEMHLDTFAFDETRYINVHMDYQWQSAHRDRFQRAYIEPGNRFPAYGPDTKEGLIELDDELVHHLKLELEDEHGNLTTVTGQIQQDLSDPEMSPLPNASGASIGYTIRRNTLVVFTPATQSIQQQGLKVARKNGEMDTWHPAYSQDGQWIFLETLDPYTYPQSVATADSLHQLDIPLQTLIRSDQSSMIPFGEMQLYFPHHSVFDQVHLTIQRLPGSPDMFSDRYRVGNSQIPVFKEYVVSLQPNRPTELDKLVVAVKSRGKWEYAGNTAGGYGNMYASIRSFGEYCLMKDETAPTIRPHNFKQGTRISSRTQRISCRVEDEFSGLDHLSIRGELDGQWVPFVYDYKTDRITYQWGEERPSPGIHELTISAKDQVGNERRAVFSISF